jgi:ABC-type Zn uptake system ZnuABC Zn-binding protein ZnuA
MVATSCEDGQIRLWELENGNQVKAWGAHGGGAAAVEYFVRPKSVAIIGLSSKPGSAGMNALTNLTGNGYAGEIHLVGRSGGDLLPVLATAAPVTLLTQAVGAGCARVEPLVSGAQHSHDLHATPADLVRLGRARVLVINGLGMETFLDSLVSSAENPRLQVIDSSRGVATLAAEGAASGHTNHDHGHEHDHKHGQANPHIWLSYSWPVLAFNFFIAWHMCKIKLTNFFSRMSFGCQNLLHSCSSI